eukprot:gene29338-51316_t
MFKALRLLLPALIPSWNFFDVIAPSPRIEYALGALPAAPLDAWREFRPRPAHLPLWRMLARLLWNRHWNETLFLVSCAERLVDQPTAHSEDEIFRRIAADLRPLVLDDLGLVLRERLENDQRRVRVSGTPKGTALAA